MNDLGVSEYGEKKYTQAIEYWEKSLQINSLQSNIYALIIDAYKQLGNKEKQILFEKKATELGYTTKL